MKDLVVREGSSNTTSLVWMVTMLGFGAGVLMLAIVYWTLSSIRSERERLDAIQVEMTRMVTSLDPYLIQGRDEMVELLDGNETAQADPGWIGKLKDLINDYRKHGGASDPDVLHALDQLAARLKIVEVIRSRCVDWNVNNAELNRSIPEVRRRIEAYLREMRAAIATTEGLQRLQYAIQIRHYRNARGDVADRLARDMVESTNNGTQISSAKAELSDLALLCERLVGEDQVDDLADIKDNEFASTLHRLRRVASFSEKELSTSGNLTMSLLERFEEALFGEGYIIDTIHQTVIPGIGGLYMLCKTRLLQREIRQELLDEVTRTFDGLRATRQQVADTVEAFSKQTAVRAERVLRHAWGTMLLLWLVSTAVFFVLSARIARTVKRQFWVIEATNRDLDTQTRALSQANQDLMSEIIERRRVEDALRQSEEALRRAKDELETRVEERTADLRNANKLLEREISERTRVEEELRKRGEELSIALESARKARETAETERDRSERMLSEVSESKRRLEILLSDASAREMRMVELKREVNDLLVVFGKDPKYEAPLQVEAFLSERRDLNDPL